MESRTHPASLIQGVAVKGSKAWAIPIARQKEGVGGHGFRRGLLSVLEVGVAGWRDRDDTGCGVDSRLLRWQLTEVPAAWGSGDWRCTLATVGEGA